MADETDQGGAPEQSGPPEWLGPIEDRMNELSAQSQMMAEQFANAFNQPEADDDDDDYLPESEWYDADGELTPEAAQEIIDQRVQEVLAGEFAERDHGAQIAHRDRLYDSLVAEIPELATDGPQIVADLVSELQAAGQQAVIDSPVFVDLIEMRFKAERYDTSEDEDEDEDEDYVAEAPSRGVVLESAGGGQAAQRGNQEDWAARVTAAAERLRPNI